MHLPFRVSNQNFRNLGVNFLFLASACYSCWFIGRSVDGCYAETWIGKNFWFGHQGYEYVDLGRFWQIFLFVGLIIWLLLMGRAIYPALKQKSENRNLLILFLISTIAIAAFYGAGLMWGRQTNLAIAEYWRWWVVHLWVEGFFEVFAAVVVAFLFVRLGNYKSSNCNTGCSVFDHRIFIRWYSWNFSSSVFYRNTNRCNGTGCNVQCTRSSTTGFDGF